MSTKTILYCWVFGEYSTNIFTAKIDLTETVDTLREVIKSSQNPKFAHIPISALLLWSVSIHFDSNLEENLKRLDLDGVPPLSPWLTLSSIFSNQPTNNHLSIVIKVPVQPSPSFRSVADISVPMRMSENQRAEAITTFLTKLRPKIKEFLSAPRHPVWMPPDTVDENTRQFYHNLAIPRINGKPNLLLHNLGDKTNPYVDTLFQNGAHHRILCNTSGAGKTALLFNGLCSRWGFYFVAARDTNNIGTKDLESAIQIMSQSQGWIRDVFENSSPDAVKKASEGNEAIAFKWVYKVLLTRWYLFRTFLEVAKEQHGGGLPPDIKRDWLLFQTLPVVFIDYMHPFIAFMNHCLVGMSLEALLRSLAQFTPKSVLGSAFNDESDHFFYVLDEAQLAGETYMGAFTDTNKEIRQPVLRPIIRAWMVSEGPIRFIVSGTGFSLSLFETVLASSVGKFLPEWEMVHQTGDFINQDLQKSYIARYLPPSFLASPSGTILVSRMYEWLRGRHRFTATFIEILLAGAWTSEGPSSPQKLLNAYVHVFTTFNPLDCDSALLAIEPDVISPHVAGFPWYKLNQDKGLLQELSTSLYTYITRGEYPMWYHEKQDLVEYGIARFIGQGDVIIEEPMALVGILRYFEAEGLTMDGGIQAQIQNGKDPVFEEAVLLSCSRIFRGGARLSDVFHFHGDVPDWAHQRARIVSQRGQDCAFEDIVNGKPVVPSAGVAYYAKQIDDIKDWITSKPNVWCVPGTLMGPDLMTWLRLDNGKLILLLIHVKCHLSENEDALNSKVTAGGIRSLDPFHFYSSLHRKSAKAERLKLLAAINTADECFTGAHYNILRVIAAYPLDARLDSGRSKEIAKALQDDKHPLATFRHAPWLSSLATCNGTILSSVASSLKRARQDEDKDGNDDHPKKKFRKKSNKKRCLTSQ